MRLLLLLASIARAAITIQDVTVIDVASASARPHLNVVMEGERIKSIGGVPVGTIVNGRGKFLIPGLWDMHAQLREKDNPLPKYIAWGVTGLQDMGGDFARVSAWRQAIEKGRAIGPRVVASGPPVEAQTPDEARKAFDKLWDMDVDFINVPSGLSRDAYFAIAEQARHWDIRIAGQVPTSVTAWEAIEARQASLEHLFGVTKAVSSDDEALRFFERCAAYGVRITPTLTMWKRTFPGELDRIRQLVALSTRTQVEVLAGTDTGDSGETLHDELEELVAAGMPPHQALRAATIAPAKFLGWDAELGSVEKGKIADLVLLNGNPLEDVRNTRRIAGVVVRGRYFPKQATLKTTKN